MSITLSQTITLLKNGKPLTWKKSGQYKVGSIQLGTAGQRRLFNFLIQVDTNLVRTADESIFEGLITAWEDETTDPANTEQSATSEAISGP